MQTRLTRNSEGEAKGTSMWNVQRYKKLPRLLTAIREWTECIIRAFFRDQCLLRASALTYVTALALVPFLAVAFSLSKGFGFQNTVYIRTLLERFAAGREEVIEHVLAYINNTDVGTLGAIGVGVLFVSVFTMLANVERTFNTIWGVQRPRQLSRKFTDYLSVVVLCPILVIASISATASLQSSGVAQKLLSVGVVDSVFGILLNLAPFFMAWLALVFVYTVMPNTRVHLFPAFIGALVAGFLWQGTQKALIHYQVGFSKYNAIYGSFGQVPLLLLWMHVSWVIVLFGAEISFALQNRNAVLRFNQGGDADLRDTHVLALAMTSLLARATLEGHRPPVLEELSQATNTPVRQVAMILERLDQAGMVAQVVREDDSRAYSLLICPDRVRVTDILERFEATGSDEARQEGVLRTAAEWVERLHASQRASESNILLSELVRELPGDLDP